MSRVLQAKNIAIRAQGIEQRLFGRKNLRFLGLADHLDDVALHAAAVCMLIHERIHQAGRIVEIGDGADICVREVLTVLHQVRHGHRVDL